MQRIIDANNETIVQTTINDILKEIDNAQESED